MRCERICIVHDFNSCYCATASHHIGHIKQQSPGGQSGRSSNLRVVIPQPMTAGMSAPDDINYGEVRTHMRLFLWPLSYQNEYLASTTISTEYAGGSTTDAWDTRTICIPFDWIVSGARLFDELIGRDEPVIIVESPNTQ